MGRPPIGKTAMTAAERMRRYRAAKSPPAYRNKEPVTKPAGADRRDEEIAQLKARVAELEAARAAVSNAAVSDTGEVAALSLAAAKARIAELEARIKEMVQESFAQAAAFRVELRRRAATPKKERPPLPPDEERDRIIKGLKTANHNLKVKNRENEKYFNEEIRKAGGMNFATQGAIAKCLHPDHKPSEDERAQACRLFTAWKADKDKARRR